MIDDYAPGMRVKHPDQPDWGLGQVQSSIDGKITVTFEHQGQVVIHSDKVSLEVVEDEDL